MMDPEVLTAKGQVPHMHDEACRSLRTSTVFGRLPTAGGVTSSQRDTRRSLSSELETKARRFRLPSLHILHVRCKFCVIRAVGRNLQILHV